MGVPGFFAWLLRKYGSTKFISTEISNKVTVLYLDANCLFHPQCFKIVALNEKWKSERILHQKMFKRILQYIDYLITFVNPEKVYIAVDGVAPMAKINQQRKRRYRSPKDKQLENKIKVEHGKYVGKVWSNTCITPGTVFMEKLHQNMIDYIKRKFENEKIQIEYSSYHVPGEGEHKILQDIKTRNAKKEIYVIYGLDADLIFLALSLSLSQIYLLREADQFGDDKEPPEIIAVKLNYVSIEKTKQCLNQEFYKLLSEEFVLSDDIDLDFTDDFIFLCYLLGNDFLPHIPSLNIASGAIDFLLKCYMDVFIYLNVQLINRIKTKTKTGAYKESVHIDNIFLEMLLRNISNYEDYYFRKLLPTREEYLSKARCPHSHPIKRKLWELEHMKLNTLKQVNDIELGSDHPFLWKFRYYEHYFQCSEYSDNMVNDLCYQYFKTLQWVTKYYFEQCPTWHYNYPYNHAPFVSDLYRYFEMTKMDINTLEFEYQSPIKPCTQLLIALPPSNAHLIPKSYRTLYNDIEVMDMFPNDFQLDMLYKEKFYQCIPFIPHIDLKRIHNVIKNKKLSEAEAKRNSDGKTIKNYMFKNNI